MQTLSELISLSESQIGQLTKAVQPRSAHPYRVAAEDIQSSTAFSGGSQYIATAMEQYKHNRGTVASAVNIPCKRIAGQPAFVGRLTNNASKGRTLKHYTGQGWIKRDSIPTGVKELNPENVEILENHSLIEALNNPNDMEVRWSMLFSTAVSMSITGRAFWMMLQEEQRTKFLYLPATWVTPVHTKQKLFAGWFVQRPGSTQPPIPVDAENMAYFHYPDPSDPFGVLGPLQQLARTVLADESIQVAQDVAFQNGIFPVHGIRVSDEAAELFSGGGGKNLLALEPGQRSQLQTWLRKQYEGARKFGTPFILDAMVSDIERISETPDKMAFQEAGEMTEGRVYKGYGVNPISAGQVEGANRASSAIADYHLVSNTVNPMLSYMSQVVTKTICPHFANEGEKLVFWLQPAEAHDPELDLEKWTAASANYAVTRNEWRSYINLPPMDGFDDVPLPVNVTSGGAADVVFSDTEDEEADKSYHGNYTKAAEALWLKQHDKHERELIKVLSVYLAEMTEHIASEIEAMDEKGFWDTLGSFFSISTWTQKLKDAVKKTLTAAGIGGAVGALELAPPSVLEVLGAETAMEGVMGSGIIDDIVFSLEESLSQPYWTDIAKNARDAIGKIIEDGLQSGLSQKEIAKRIREELPGMSEKRALRIARTEITAALNEGHELVRQELSQNGLVSGKEWRTVGDSKVRGLDPADDFDHVGAHGQKVGPNEPFVVSGEETPYPGWHGMSAGSRINCRCLSLSLFDGVVPFDNPDEDDSFEQDDEGNFI